MASMHCSDSQSEVNVVMDRISNLHEDIVQLILTFMPLKDAVRTSVLSKGWRYKWTSIPSFMFSNNNYGFEWSSPFYTCPSLTLLDLKHCVLEPPPPFFNGFKNLKTLCLMFVALSERGFESLLRGCPVLENLTFVCVERIKRLIIDSPRLQTLKVFGRLDSIMFADTHPQLSEVSIWFVTPVVGAESYMAELFTKIPNVETLTIFGHFLTYLSRGLIPERLPTPCYNLHSLALHADLHDESHILGLLCILRSTPNLTRLEITDERWPLGELENMDWRCGSTLDKLTTLVIYQWELKKVHFVTYLLQNLTALEKVTICVPLKDIDQQIITAYKPYTRALIDVVLDEFSEHMIPNFLYN